MACVVMACMSMKRLQHACGYNIQHITSPRLTFQVEGLDGVVDLERGRQLRHAGVADLVVCMQQGHVSHRRDQRADGTCECTWLWPVKLWPTLVMACISYGPIQCAY